MASFEPIDFDPLQPPPRPTTPAVRRGFLLILLGLLLAVGIVYGVPFVAHRAGYAYEAGRAEAAIEALQKLDEDDVILRSSALFRLASRAVAPAVVNVRNWQPLAGHPEVGGGMPGPGRGLLPTGSGSGVIIDKARGFVVTNHHVVEGAGALTVRLGRGGERRAELVGSDPKTDLAVLRVDGPLPAEARWGDSSQLDIGDWVLAIGSPLMLDQTVTAGIVSATGRNDLPIMAQDAYEDFIQTDAALNPGNSGGPLIDLRGQVVGINTAIASLGGESGGNVGIGFAISSALARRVVEQIIKEGKVVRGYVGIVMSPIAPGEPGAPAGFRIEGVNPDGPAAGAGLRPGDLVVSLDGAEVRDMNSFRSRVGTLPAGTKLRIGYLRDGEPGEAELTVARMPVTAALGLILGDLELDPGRPGGPVVAVITNVLPGSPAARAGLAQGFRIIGVGRDPVGGGVEGLRQALEGFDPATEAIPLHVVLPNGTDAWVPVGGPG